MPCEKKKKNKTKQTQNAQNSSSHPLESKMIPRWVFPALQVQWPQHLKITTQRSHAAAYPDLQAGHFLFHYYTIMF